jgi:hypothetical protein
MKNVHFEWNNFGLLTEVTCDDKMIYIVNSQGLKLKMSVAKYKATAERVKQQAKSLIGSNVRVRTSKNTANWSSAEWFSDILSEV